MQGFHAVMPKNDCPHCIVDNIIPLDDLLSRGIKVTDACKTCAVAGEVWLCLKCGDVQCSRYVNGDMAKHNE